MFQAQPCRSCHVPSGGTCAPLSWTVNLSLGSPATNYYPDWVHLLSLSERRARECFPPAASVLKCYKDQGLGQELIPALPRGSESAAPPPRVCRELEQEGEEGTDLGLEPKHSSTQPPLPTSEGLNVHRPADTAKKPHSWHRGSQEQAPIGTHRRPTQGQHLPAGLACVRAAQGLGLWPVAACMAASLSPTVQASATSPSSESKAPHTRRCGQPCPFNTATLNSKAGHSTGDS